MQPIWPSRKVFQTVGKRSKLYATRMSAVKADLFYTHNSQHAVISCPVSSSRNSHYKPTIVKGKKKETTKTRKRKIRNRTFAIVFFTNFFSGWPFNEMQETSSFQKMNHKRKHSERDRSNWKSSSLAFPCLISLFDLEQHVACSVWPESTAAMNRTVCCNIEIYFSWNGYWTLKSWMIKKCPEC